MENLGLLFDGVASSAEPTIATDSSAEVFKDRLEGVPPLEAVLADRVSELHSDGVQRIDALRDFVDVGLRLRQADEHLAELFLALVHHRLVVFQRRFERSADCLQFGTDLALHVPAYHVQVLDLDRVLQIEHLLVDGTSCQHGVRIDHLLEVLLCFFERLAVLAFQEKVQVRTQPKFWMFSDGVHELLQVVIANAQKLGVEFVSAATLVVNGSDLRHESPTYRPGYSLTRQVRSQKKSLKRLSTS